MPLTTRGPSDRLRMHTLTINFAPLDDATLPPPPLPPFGPMQRATVVSVVDPGSATELPRALGELPPGGVAEPTPGGINCHPGLSMPMRAPGPSARQLKHQRKGVSAAPRVACSIPRDVEARLVALGGPDYAAKLKGRKGSKHVARCPGHWASAFFDLMPNLIPKSGPARAKAGLASVPLDGAEVEANLLRRAGCALVAILPYECAEFILRDPPALIESRPCVDTAGRMVDALTDVSGVGAIETATSVLGNLLAWCIAKRHGELMISGSTCTDYFKANPPSTNTNAGSNSENVRQTGVPQ